MRMRKILRLGPWSQPTVKLLEMRLTVPVLRKTAAYARLCIAMQACRNYQARFFTVWPKERCRKRPGGHRNALRASAVVRATDVMVNLGDLQV